VGVGGEEMPQHEGYSFKGAGNCMTPNKTIVHGTWYPIVGQEGELVRLAENYEEQEAGIINAEICAGICTDLGEQCAAFTTGMRSGRCGLLAPNSTMNETLSGSLTDREECFARRAEGDFESVGKGYCRTELEDGTLEAGPYITLFAEELGADTLEDCIEECESLNGRVSDPSPLCTGIELREACELQLAPMTPTTTEANLCYQKNS